MKKLLTFIIAILGILLVIIGSMYLIEPAKSLPTFFPGYDGALLTKHYKHGIGAIILGLACFAFTWFNSGKKSSEEKDQGNQSS